MHWKAQSFNYLHYLNAPIEAVFQKIVSCMSSALQQHKTSVALGYLANWNIIPYDKFFMSCLRTGKKKGEAAGGEQVKEAQRGFVSSFVSSLQTFSRLGKKNNRVALWKTREENPTKTVLQLMQVLLTSPITQNHKNLKLSFALLWWVAMHLCWGFRYFLYKSRSTQKVLLAKTGHQKMLLPCSLGLIVTTQLAEHTLLFSESTGQDFGSQDKSILLSFLIESTSESKNEVSQLW